MHHVYVKGKKPKKKGWISHSQESFNAVNRVFSFLYILKTSEPQRLRRVLPHQPQSEDSKMSASLLTIAKSLNRKFNLLFGGKQGNHFFIIFKGAY